MASGSKYYEGIDYGSLPNNYGSIMTKIDQLHSAFVEMYQREYALEQWPDYEFIIRLSLDEAQRRQTRLNNSVLGNTSVQDLQHPHRPPHVLPFRVPQDASEGDEQVIDDMARADAETAVDEIRSAFKESLDDGSLASCDVLLIKAAETVVAVESLIETHERSGFLKLRELFESWQGSDADAGMEKYGSRMRVAAGLHRQIAVNLLMAGAAECAAKLTAQLQLGEALDKVHGEIETLRTGTDPSVKITVRTAFNEIPHSGGLVSIADGVGEMLGGDDSVVSDWLNGVFDALELDYEMGLQPQNASKLKTELLATATTATEGLEEARDLAKENLELDYGTWHSFYSTDPQVLIPGEADS